MDKSIIIDSEVKIKNAGAIWEKIKKQKTPVNIDMSKVDKVDGAGLQLMIYIYELTCKYPKKYISTGISETLEMLMISFGFEFKKGDIKK